MIPLGRTEFERPAAAGAECGKRRVFKEPGAAAGEETRVAEDGRRGAPG